jgi:hypothetical protein
VRHGSRYHGSRPSPGLVSTRSDQRHRSSRVFKVQQGRVTGRGVYENHSGCTRLLGLFRGKDSGGGERFTQFIRDEVMPKILAGHSVGGLAAIDCMFLHPEMFDAYIAISPSLWWDRGYALSLAKTKLNRLQGQKKFLFLADSPETGSFHELGSGS